MCASDSDPELEPDGDPARVTALLADLRAGEADAHGRLLELVYPELRRLAAAVMNGQARAHTLQPTALVHEAFLKLAGGLDGIEDRRHFLVVAGKAMRQVLVDHARGRQALKRGGGIRRMTLDSGAIEGAEEQLDVVALNDCLDALSELNPRHAQVVELRLFSGLSIDETAAELGVSPRTVDNDWALARAWLRQRLA